MESDVIYAEIFDSEGVEKFTKVYNEAIADGWTVAHAMQSSDVVDEHARIVITLLLVKDHSGERQRA